MSEDDQSQDSQQRSFRSRLQKLPQKDSKVDDKEQKELLKKKREEIKELDKSLKKQSKGELKIAQFYETAKSEISQSQSMSSISSVKSELIPKIKEKRQLAKVSQSLKSGNFKNEEDVKLALQKHKNIVPLKITRDEDKVYQELFDIINFMTDREFETGGRHLVFNKINNLIKGNNQYIIIHIQDLKYTKVKDLLVNSELELKQPINPPMYFWEVLHNRTPLFCSSKKNFDNIQFECLDFMYRNNYLDPLEIILWKSQNNKNTYVGQFTIDIGEFEQLEDVKTFDRRTLRAKQPKKVQLVRKQQDDRKIQGEVIVKYKIIQYTEKVEPQNNISNVRGSPRQGDLNERMRRKLVERAKELGEYQWKLDQDAKSQVIVIDDMNKDYVEIVTIDQAKGFISDLYKDGVMNLLSGDDYKLGDQIIVRKFAVSRRVPKSEALQNILKSLEEDPKLQVMEGLRSQIRKGRVSKEDLSKALATLGASPTEIFALSTNSFGGCLMDDLFSGINLGLAIDLIPQMNLEKQENAEALEMVADKFFQTVKDTLKQRDSLEGIVKMMDAIQDKPEFALIIAQFADQYQHSRPQKDGQDVPIVFLEHFDINKNHPNKMDNYEHIMLLGKIRKLAKKYLTEDSSFLKDLDKAYTDAKTSLYFVVPILPKNVLDRFEEKKHLLVLGEEAPSATGENKVEFKQVKKQVKGKTLNVIEKKLVPKTAEEKELEQLLPPPCMFNIFHENVRRKRWNNLYKGFSAAPDYFYQKDSTDRSTFAAMIEEAPFDVIMSFLVDFLPKNKEGEEPVEYAEGQKPKQQIDPKKLIASTNNRQNKNILHSIASNPIPVPSAQLKCLQQLNSILTPEEAQQFQNQPIKGQEIIPICQYINTLASIKNKIAPKDQEFIIQIIQELSSNVTKEFDFYQFHAYFGSQRNNLETQPIDENLQSSYINNVVQIARGLSKFDDRSYDIIGDQINWINWFGLSFDGLSRQDAQFLMFNLARNGSFKKLGNVLQNFRDQVFKKLPKVIQEKDDIALDHSNNCFVSAGDGDDQGDNKGDDQDDNNKKSGFVLKGYVQEEVEPEKFQNKLVDIQAFDNMDQRDEFLKKFYEKYPLDAFVGLVEIFEEQQFKQVPILQLVIQLIQDIIMEEPRTLAQCLSLRSHKVSPFQTVKQIMKKYSKKDISELVPKYHIQMLDPQEQSQLEQIEQDPLSISDVIKPETFEKMLKKNEIPQLLNKIQQFSQLKDLIKDVDGEQKDDLPALLYASSQVLKRIINNHAKLVNQVKFSQISNIVKNCPSLCAKNCLRTPLIDAFSNPKNTVLMNQLLSTIGNPALQRHKLIQKPSSCLLSQENYLKSLETHYALGLNLAQFKQLLQDTADMTNSNDVAGMSFILAKNGLPDKLALVINKVDQGDVLLSMARQSILQQAKLLRIYSKKDQGQGRKYQGQPKDKYIPEDYESMNEIKQNLIVLDEDKKRKPVPLPEFKKIQRPYTLPTKQKYIKSLWEAQGDKKVAQQIYEQNLRRTFLTQNIKSGFNRWKTEDKQNYEEALKLVLGAIKNDKIEAVREKFKESDPLFVEKITKKAYLLPISQDNYDLIFLSLNPKVTILKAADAIIQYHLRIHPSETIRNDKKTRQARCLAFLAKHFKKDLVEVFNSDTHRPKLFRILRSIDFTLKKSQDDYNLMFATQAALIIVKNFEQDDFQNIIKNHEQFYNSIAVAMMRSRTRNMDAIKFIAQQVDKQEFFDLVCEVEDKKTLNVRTRIDIQPVKIEIEAAIILVPLTLNNVDYITFLLKNKIRPFFKSYQLEKGIPTIPILNNEPIKELNLLQQLIYRNHEVLVKQQLWNELKPKGKLQGNEDWSWLIIGIASGNLNMLELIIKDVLQLNADLFFDQIIRSDQGILNNLILYFNEDQVVKFLNTYMFPYECKQDPKDYEFIKISFETMIGKKYVKYWRFITKFMLENIADNDINKYKEVLLKFAETKILSTSQSDHEMTYLEYSISEGFLDIGMMLGDLKLAENPFGPDQMEIYNKFQNIGHELAQSEAILSKSKDPLKSKYYQFYLLYSKFMKNQSIVEINKTRSFIMLIEIARKYCEDSQYYFQMGKFNEIIILTFAGIPNHQYYIDDFDVFMHEQVKENSHLILKNEMEFLFILHINGFDKILKYRQSIVDYVNTQCNPTFWSNKQIQEILLKQFKIDITNIKPTMTIPSLYSIDQLYNIGGPIIKSYILMNQQIINLNPQLEDSGNPDDDLTDYQKLPIIKAQDLIIQIRSQSIDNPNFEQLVLSLKNFMNELDSNGSLFRALLAVAIVDFVVHVDEIMEIINADINSTVHPVTQLLQYGVRRFGLQQMSVQINLLLQGLKTNNKVYLALMKYPLAKEIKITNRQGKESLDVHPLNKDLIKEKHMVNGLSEFLRSYTRREKFNITISDKEINKCLSFDNSKQNPLASDKIYKGFMIIKFFLDLAFELDQLFNEISNSEYEYEFEIQTQAFNMREIPKQQVTTNKIVEVKNEQKEFQYYKLLLTVPILITDYEGSCYMVIPPNIMKQIKAIQEKHQFDTIQFKEMLEFVSNYSRDIGSVQAFLSLSPQNINADNFATVRSDIDDMFGFARAYSKPDFQVISLLQGIDEVSNYKKRSVLTLEEELNYEDYVNHEYKLQLKAILCSKEQFNDKNASNKLLKKLIDDFVMTAKQIQFQQKEGKEGAELISRDIEWPFYIYQEQVFSNHLAYPLYIYYEVCTAVDNYFRALKYRINYISIIESYLIKWAAMLDIQAKGQIVPIQKLLSTAFQWPLFGYVLNETFQSIKQYFQTDQIIFEFSDTFKQANNKGLYFSGFDQIVRFGSNNYFYHKGNLIVRINILFIRNDLSPLEELIKNKQKPKQPVGDIQPYVDSILNKQELIQTLEFIGNK